MSSKCSKFVKPTHISGSLNCWSFQSEISYQKQPSSSDESSDEDSEDWEIIEDEETKKLKKALEAIWSYLALSSSYCEFSHTCYSQTSEVFLELPYLHLYELITFWMIDFWCVWGVWDNLAFYKYIIFCWLKEGLIIKYHPFLVHMYIHILQFFDIRLICFFFLFLHILVFKK